MYKCLMPGPCIITFIYIYIFMPMTSSVLLLYHIIAMQYLYYNTCRPRITLRNKLYIFFQKFQNLYKFFFFQEMENKAVLFDD